MELLSVPSELIRDFIQAGGDVLYLIAILVFFMWSMIIERLWYFMSGEHGRAMAEALRDWESRAERVSWNAHQIRAQMISEMRAKIFGPVDLIQTCVSLCPLLGLLGTVTGMIAVFEVMATQGGNARSMAAGVQTATIPTMAGMVSALSGVFAMSYLKSKTEFEAELFEDTLALDH